jgi:hypothetical protein
MLIVFLPSNPNRFRVRAFGDKVLLEGRIKFMLFFESDEKFRGGPFHVGPYRLFPTPDGWHVVGEEVATAEKKRHWFAAWKDLYPDSDYKLDRWNFLRPHTKAEAEFILTRSGAVPQTCYYYRDKQTWETFEQWLRKNPNHLLERS